MLKLGHVWVREKKLKVNVSRFERDLVVSTPVAVVSPTRVQPISGEAHIHLVMGGVSFASAVAVESNIRTSVGLQHSLPVLMKLVCEVPVGRVEELSNCVVGLLQHRMCVKDVCD